MCVTSPPYWGLRDYGLEPIIWGGKLDCDHRWNVRPRLWGGGTQGKNGQRADRAFTAHGESKHAFCQHCEAWRGSLGLEPTPQLYIEHIVAVFREVRRVLRDDGTLWLNLGDCYSGSGRGTNGDGSAGKAGVKQRTNAGSILDFHDKRVEAGVIGRHWIAPPPGLKQKDLVGIPWRVAFALQADGWYLRSDIIWSKPNPMPESVRDRPTRSHEYLFLLSKGKRYHYDYEAVKEPNAGGPSDIRKMLEGKARLGGKSLGNEDRLNAAHARTKIGTLRSVGKPTGRNRRSVWTIGTQPYKGAHFATFPERLAEPCILAGSRPGGIVLDPFGGAGTVGRVAKRHGRRFVLIDINPEYCDLARARVAETPIGTEIRKVV